MHDVVSTILAQRNIQLVVVLIVLTMLPSVVNAYNTYVFSLSNFIYELFLAIKIKQFIVEKFRKDRQI